jgi:malonyl CoA-acyl carrier protein transacylase
MDLVALLIHFPAGPKVKLDDTVYSQPALFVANLAALEVLRARDSALVTGEASSRLQPSQAEEIIIQ